MKVNRDETRQVTKLVLRNFHNLIDHIELYQIKNISFKESIEIDDFRKLLIVRINNDEKTVKLINMILSYANNLKEIEKSYFYFHILKGYSKTALRNGVDINDETVCISNIYQVEKRVLDKLYYHLHLLVPLSYR